MASSVFKIITAVGSDITIFPNASSFEIGTEVLFNVNGTNLTNTFTVTSIAGPDTIAVTPAPTGIVAGNKVVDLALHQRKRLLGLI